MMRETRSTAARFIAAGLLAATPAIVGAHPPYAYEVAAITDAGGRRLHIFKAFTDGIVLPDPVTLELRDASGRTVAQSPRLTDVAVLCRQERRCLVFGYDSEASVLLPTEVWRISGPQLTPVTTTRMRLAGVAVHVWNNWLGYIVALVSVFVPLAILQRIQRLPAGPLRRGLLTGGSVVGALFLIPWYFVIALSNLSLVVLLVGGAGLAFASHRLGSLKGRRAAQQGDEADER